MALLVNLCVLGVLASSVTALNDWTKACLAGECSYDLAANSLHIVGILLIPVPQCLTSSNILVWLADRGLGPHASRWLADP